MKITAKATAIATSTTTLAISEKQRSIKDEEKPLH